MNQRNVDTMQLSIFTLNIWGLKFFAKNRTERVKALAESLTANGYDVVCLQELWCDDNYNYLKQSCQNIFKYIHYFHSGMLGSGMCIMSRYPIVDTHYHSFILNGYLHMVWHGDWFGGKGIGLCRLNVKGFIVDVYTTHLHACYDTSKDKYINHRIIQAFETANFIRITSTNSDLAVLAGDLNSEPNEIYYKLISLSANLKDCYSMCLTNDIKYTFNHPQNSYKNPKESKTRLDYILYKYNKNNSVIVKDHRHSLPSRVPGQNYSYSDHEPIEAVFEISANKCNFDTNIIDKDLKYEIELQEIINVSLNICNEKSVLNPLISIWHYIIFLISLIIIYYQPLPLSVYLGEHYIIILIFSLIIMFKIAWIYNKVTKSIEHNCVRGFCQQIGTLFHNQ